MPRRAEDREFVLPVRGHHISLQRWLYSELRGAILNGRLAPGTRLPSTRDLAQQYGVARGTVSIAYDQLAAEGYLSASVGSGTFVEHRDCLTASSGVTPNARDHLPRRINVQTLSAFLTSAGPWRTRSFRSQAEDDSKRRFELGSRIS